MQALFWRSDKNRLTSTWAGSIIPTMQAAEATLEKLFRHNPDIKEVCRQIGWGTIEISIKEGKPAMVTVKKDIKLS